MVFFCLRRRAPSIPAAGRGLFNFSAASSGIGKSPRKRAGFSEDSNSAANPPYSAFALFLTSYIL